MTGGSPTFGELWPTLADRIGGRPVVAHNASLDMSVLRHELDHVGRRLPRSGVLLHAGPLARLLAGAAQPPPARRGVALRDRFSPPRPAEDARARAEILLRISTASGAAAPRDVAARHGVRPGRLYADGYGTCSRR